MNIGGYLLSLLLHGAVIATVLLWPATPMLRIDQPMIQISLTMGAPGGDEMPSPVLGHVPDPVPDKPLAAAMPEAPKPDVAKAEPLPDPALLKKPDALAEKQPDVPKASPRPLPPPEPKPEPKPAPEAKPQKPEKKPVPKKPADSPLDVLKAALAKARQAAGGSALSGAIADAERTEKMPAGGGGGEGEGEGGGGLYNVYAGQVILAVRPNWSMPTYSREPLVAHVRVILDAAGNVLEARLERGSKRPDFNASTVNAVLRTRKLPPPPTPAQQNMVIVFNSLELMGQ